MTIPIIDFALYDEKKIDTLAQLAREVDLALTTWGFISLKNIGIDTELRRKTFANARKFFNRPLEEKRRYAYSDPKANFGYQAPLTETLEPGQPADLKEAFTMRDLQGHLTDHTAWPDEYFRVTAHSFFEACMQAAFRVLRVLAVALEEDSEYFVKMHSGENVTMRYLHYPSSGFDVANKQMGAGAHTDYGVVTSFPRSCRWITAKKWSFLDRCSPYRGNGKHEHRRLDDALEQWTLSINLPPSITFNRKY